MPSLDSSNRPPPSTSGSRHGGLFPQTQWSLIRRVQHGDETQRREGMEILCTAYWKPVYAWLRARGSSPEDAEDLTQEFFSRLIAGDWLAEVSAEKGRLRSFLLVLLKRHAANVWEFSQAKKRGGGCVIFRLDAGDAETAWKNLPADGVSPDVIFDRQWALQLLDGVMQGLRDTYAKAGKTDLFDELRGYITGGSADESYGASALRLGMNEGTVKVAAFRLRERYRDRLRAAVLETVESPGGVAEEIAWLFRVFQ